MRALVVLVLALICLAAAPASAYYPWDVWQADRAFQKGDYQEAGRLYRKALEGASGDARALYGLAQCQYRTGKFAEARESFGKALAAGNPEFRARAAYNLGNALFREEKLEEALEAYKTALRWDESDDDARYNIQVLLEKLRQKKDQKNQQKDDKDQKKDQQDKKDQQKDKQDKKQDDKDQKKDQQDKKQGDKDQQKDRRDQKKDPQQDQKDQQQKPGQRQAPMSREDAERLLKYFADKEKHKPDRKARLVYPPIRGTEIW
ncbi:MAG: tetratricopeptide repeat protein [Armatimonadetes bacterium]|nr:tetratricopeptide repeat protein [Armatimonadota bacterium]